MHCTKRIWVHKNAQWAQICIIEHRCASWAQKCTVNTNLRCEHKCALWIECATCRHNVHMCTDAEVRQPRGEHTAWRLEPQVLRPAQAQAHIHPSKVLQCLMCRGAMRLELRIDTLLLFAVQSTTKPKAFNFLFCLLPHQSRREKYPQVVARVSHQKSPRRFMGRGWRWRREGKVDAKSFLTRIKSTTQSASLNDLSAVPSPLCPHDSTPGEVFKF